MATGPDFINEVMRALELMMLDGRAQAYGLAAFSLVPGERPRLAAVEHLDQEGVAQAEMRVARASSMPDQAPEVEAGDCEVCLVLAATEGRESHVIYGRCERPFTPAQVRDLKILSEVARLAYAHALERAVLCQMPGHAGRSMAPAGPSPAALPGMVYASRAMHDVARVIERIKNSESTVLVTGESGTGKELVAQAIHRLSRRSSGPFVPFNCTAAPADLIESMLFGHRKGAFTGALNDNPGLIRSAEGGTLFLDEIGDLPASLQPKLLRFLQEGEVYTLGERTPRRVNVRIVCATHKDLERAVREGTFRQDLYYRIASLVVPLVPLRERPEDIYALTAHFLAHHAKRNNLSYVGITAEAVRALQKYQWPGNVRELAAEIERLVLFADEGQTIGVDCLSPRIQQEYVGAKAVPQDVPANLDRMIEDFERQVITDTLKRHDYNVAHAAAALGLTSRQTLYKKLKRLMINVGDFFKDESQAGLELRAGQFDLQCGGFSAASERDAATAGWGR
jgi:transcriptional regulator with GAF, ATPase, and Fis domain